MYDTWTHVCVPNTQHLYTHGLCLRVSVRSVGTSVSVWHGGGDDHAQDLGYLLGSYVQVYGG